MTAQARLDVRRLLVRGLALLLVAVVPYAATAEATPASIAAQATTGTVDANATTYLYAPAFIHHGGRYHYFACGTEPGFTGDVIRHKSATTLAGLQSAAFTTVLRPNNNEVHACDPSVVRGPDGTWYLHYSNEPQGFATGAGVATSTTIGGQYTALNRNLLGRFPTGTYGRGQTSVVQGHDGAYYLAFSNFITTEDPSIVVLRSTDPAFIRDRTEVARLNPSEVRGASTSLVYDAARGRYLFVEPALGPDGFTVSEYDTSFRHLETERLLTPPGARTPGEGQALLVDALGRLATTTPSAPNRWVFAGSTYGPARSTYPTWVTGPNQWWSYPASRLYGPGLVPGGGFEGGTDWQHSPGTDVALGSGTARSGNGFLATNAHADPYGSVYRDAFVDVQPGDTYCATAYLRNQTAGATGTASLNLFLIGPTSTDGTAVKVPKSTLGTGATWKPATTCVQAHESHSLLRVQLYPGTDDKAVHIDDVDVHRSLVPGGAFEGTDAGWQRFGTTDVAIGANDGVNDAHSGTGYYAANAHTDAGGAVYRDVAVDARAGDTYCASSYLRNQSAGATGTASFNLFLIGVTATEGSGTPVAKTTLGTGNNWKQVTTCVQATSSHSTLRVQLHPGADDKAVHVDDIDVHRSAVPGGGFEGGTDWLRFGAGTDVALGSGTARSGNGYLATNAHLDADGSVYRDVTVDAQPGDTFCASAYLRNQTAGASGTASFNLFLIGLSTTEGGAVSVPKTTLGTGANWKQVATCVQATTAHSVLRVQLYPGVDDKAVHIDDVDVY